MPAPQASYVTRSSDKEFDPATLSDEEDDDAVSVTSRSTWTSSAAEGGETTILGLTDGRIPLANVDELSDWKISRVGGLPSFPLSVAPSVSACLCQSCSRAMPLLAQVYCPLPTSSLERVLYVFSCARPACRRKAGAIRAWRANGLWVEGAAEEARKAEEDARRVRDEQEKEEQRKRAQAIDLGGLVFGGGGSSTGGGGGGGLGAAAAASTNPFGTTTSSATASSASANAKLAASTNPFALPAASSSSSSLLSATPANPFAPAVSSPSAFNPFAVPAPATTIANPFAPPPAASPAVAPSVSAASLSAAADPVRGPGTLEPITSTWSAATSATSPDSPSSLTSTLPAYPAWYLSTMYEPAGAVHAGSSSATKGKSRAREADLAALAGGMTLGPGGQNDSGQRDENDSDGDDEWDRSRPGKGAGGRTKKGAAGGQGRKDGSGKTKTTVASSGGGGSAGGGGGGWEGEGYEVQKVKGVDEVFLRFQERVQREGRQVVRYEFGAHPVPYTASSAAYRLAFPPAGPASSSSLAAHPGPNGVATSTLGAYTPARLPRCRSCDGPTTFEAQLMPHLVGLVNGAATAEGEGQDWATVWVLSCEAECEGGAQGGGEGESWREERVLVEWEEEAV